MTRVLGAIAQADATPVVFSAGTSLSKACGLTQRLGDSIDLGENVGSRGESLRDALMKEIG